jgi:hypothetical protein
MASKKHQPSSAVWTPISATKSALLGHAGMVAACPLWGAKQTFGS